MKKLAAIACLTLLASGAFAQGLVNFFNQATSLISVDLGQGPVVMPSGAAGTYYFALLTAASGTTDPKAFTASGVTGANQAVAGRFTGGASVSVSGWAAGATKSFEVVGWAASLGTAYDPAWLANGIGTKIGVSTIGTGAAGGFDGTATLPTLNLFSASQIAGGFVIPVPEPTSMALAGLGAAALLIFRRRN